MLLLILAAIFADLISPARYDFSVLSDANQFPSRAHLAGTDGVGRDFLSRLIYGARVSLTVGLSVQAIAVLIGMTLGTLAGSFGLFFTCFLLFCRFLPAVAMAEVNRLTEWRMSMAG